MCIAFILPIKSFDRGKSRLAGTLSEADRHDLNRMLSKHTVNQLADLQLDHKILIVSSDKSVIDNTDPKRSIGILDDCDQPSLTTAVCLAASHAREVGAKWTCYVPIDLPLLRSAEMCRIVKTATKFGMPAIIPSSDGQTTALLLIPTFLDFRYHFGKMSFWRHTLSLLSTGQPFAIERSFSLEHDLDTIEDVITIRGFLHNLSDDNSATEEQSEILKILFRAKFA